MERLRANGSLRAALGGITAAVLGVVASLAISLGTGVLFDETTLAHPFGVDVIVPRLASLELLHAAIAVGAFWAVRRRIHVAWVVLASAAVGVIAAALQ